MHRTVPSVKKVLHKCKPNYTTVHFATTGFEGITNTDEEVAMMGAAEEEDTTSDDDSVNDSADGAEDRDDRDVGRGGKRGNKRAVKRDHKQSSKQDGITAVTTGSSDSDIPLASVAQATPPNQQKSGQVRARVCRRSKRWTAC